MARVQTMVQLTDDLVDVLDEEARRLGVSRSSVIRDVLNAYLQDRRTDELRRAYVDGYRRLPPMSPDEWGDLGQALAVSEGELLRRLDREEQAGGHDTW